MTRYTTSQTITAPAAGTYAIYCWGGGAGSRTALSAASSGGGGGACSIKSLVVTAGQQLVLTIGAAGNGTSGAFGPGGDTSVQSPSGTTVCLAKGAPGATGGASASGTGDTKYSGGNGGGSSVYTDPETQIVSRAWGGGGGAAGSGGIGGNGGNATTDFGDPIDGGPGAGGSGTYGGGNGGYKFTTSAGTPGGGAAGGDGGGGLGAVELIFTPSAAAPVITPSTTAFNVNENTAFAQDFNADQGVTWSLVGGTDQSKFTISGAGNLQMVAKDYEAPDDSNADRVYQVTFRATNTDGSGLFTNKTVTVTVVNDTSAPTITPATAAFNVANGVAFSQDYNSNQAGTTWSIVGGADAAQFSIDANGLISMAAKSYASPVDVGGNNVYDVTFRATGPEGVTTDKTIAVTVLPPPSHEFPTSSSQDASGTASRTWLNLANLYSDNELTANLQIGVGNTQTSSLATLGGFNWASIPDNATINGIELVSEISPPSGSGSVAATIQFNLFSGAGVAKSTRSYVRTDAEFIETLGGASDVWGLSGANLTGADFKANFNVTMREIAAATGTGASNPAIDYVKVKVYYTVPDDLVSTNIETSDAQITEATVGQVHVLAAQAVSGEVPAIGTATLGQKHALASTNIASGTPVIAVATIGQRHAISNINIATAAPAITAAAIGQKHTLASVTVATTAPAISLATITPMVNLTSTNIVTSAPAISLATANRIVAATSINISTAAPAITTAAVGQRHVLASTNLSGVAPAISLSTVGQRHTLATVALAGNIPTIQAATVGQRHALITTNVATSAPAITAAVLGVIPAETRQAVPIETTIQGQWTTETGGSDLHNSIDELAPNDSDFIKSEPDVVNNITRIKLGGWQATSVHGIMKLRYRLQRVGPNTAFTQTVRLYDGSTLIAGPFVHNVDTIQAFEQDVDSALVTNPNNLFVEFEAA